METLYVDRRATRLGFEAGAVVVRTGDGGRRTVPLEPLDRIVLRGEAEVSTRLLAECWRRDVGVLLLAGRFAEPTARLLGRPHGDVRRRLAQVEAYGDRGRRTAVARELVAAKVAGHRRLLARLREERADLRRPLGRGLERLDAVAAGLAAPPPDVAELLGREGAAAAAFFEAFAPAFAPALGFHRRNRRPPTDPVNVVLSLGYTLVGAEAARQAQIAGLDPLLGFLHEPAPNRPALAADLTEPLRPHVDAFALALFRDGELRADHFGREGEACRMGKAGRERFYVAWEARAGPIARLLRRRCRALVRALGEAPEDAP